MSGLLKSASEPRVRAFLEPAEPAAAPVHDPRLAALESEVEDLRAALAAQRKAGEDAVAAARAEGERSGRAAAGDAADKRLAALGAGLGAALEAWNQRLESLEGLSTALAKAALAKLFDDDEAHSQLVAGLLARQMRRLRRDSLLAVRVSAADFPDAAALAALADETGTGSVRLAADAGLKPGECRIDLNLGHLDIGAAAQWAELAAFLDALGSDGGE